MTSLMKISLLCVFSIFCLTQVESRTAALDIDDDTMEKDTGDRRGIIDNVLNVLRPVQPSNINVLPPNVFPETAVAPTIQLPSISTVNTQNRPIAQLLAGVLGNGVGDGDFNRRWLNYALQRCARVDPKQLTAILPTTANGLRAPKLYFFQNETAGAQTWFQAQEECSKKGMSLLTVNDANENKVIVEKLKAIMASSTPGTITPAVVVGANGQHAAYNAINPTSFWIGLNTLNNPNTLTWVGDGSSLFTDWHTNIAEPAAVNPTNPSVGAPGTLVTNPKYCVAYNQLTSVDNIKMDALDCLNVNTKFRYICEVSDECTALFFSRLPKALLHSHTDGNTPHIHMITG